MYIVYFILLLYLFSCNDKWLFPHLCKIIWNVSEYKYKWKFQSHVCQVDKPSSKGWNKSRVTENILPTIDIVIKTVPSATDTKQPVVWEV
jgi:hypothetical protein